MLTGTETDLGTNGQTTWYVVNSNISHSGKIDCWGDVNIILCDGKTMTMSNDGNNSIWGHESGTLTTYGQTNGTGTLNADEKSAINGKTLSRLTALSLADNADNATAITKCNGANGLDITLAGRTLSKSGEWNTLTLPFGVTAEQMAETTHPLYGATIKELDNTASGTSLSGDGTLTLKFSDALTAIEAGKPYIVKWEKSIYNPRRAGSTVAAAPASPGRQRQPLCHGHHHQPRRHHTGR